MVDTFYDTTLCSKFGREEKVLENCKLDETQSSTYRNGWLENYDVLQGELMMQIPATENIDLITDLYIDGKSNFMTSGEKMLKFLASNSSTYQKLYQNPISSPNKFSLAILPNSNQLLFPNSQGIEKLNATCANLYKSCKELKNGGFKDPQKCAWCAKNYQFYTISQVEEKCTTIFTDQCPPLVQDVSRFANRTGIMIRGDDLKNINNLVVKYCETPCKVSSHDDRTILCETENSNKDILNDCEDIEMTGNIGSKQYSLPYRIEKSDGSVQTEEITGDHNKGASPTWKITLTIIAVLLLCFVVVILVYCMRNRLQHIKPAIRPPLRNDRVENDYHMDYITSAPRLSSLSNLGDQYVKIFRDLPIGLKIDYNSLRIDAFNVLGEGQYGMVYLAEYTDEEHHDVETVVCKKMKEGRISEFYEEARTMASFDHPNVVRLIGVALEDVTHVPLLIMEYMPRGDLLSLLKDKDANITMRDIFQFAIGIAEGMAHIHSKRFVHRDLAARNVMLDRDMKAKIADFGLCRKVNEQTQTYAGIQDRKLPISYYPPEVFENIQFTLSSDVWSFGIVIWELFTRGWVPYGNVDLQVLRRLLMENENNRLPKPVHCPQKVYDEIMLPCWRADPNRRPIFNELVITLGNVLDYMERSEKSALHAGYERISIPGRSENSTSSSDICE
ncbi:unnamed protein product [Caenorhabditis angaria]|uniref:receptor protein-tyrosine kinase n=1 Tax=Caenorhabditis angaria TaxID=860376 RepID=A0A9P1J6N4_9PELO|nr:unnamed protein product [Caenorhabditis angaria]